MEAAGTVRYLENVAQLAPELAAVDRQMASHFEGGISVSLLLGQRAAAGPAGHEYWHACFIGEIYQPVSVEDRS